MSLFRVRILSPFISCRRKVELNTCCQVSEGHFNTSKRSTSIDSQKMDVHTKCVTQRDVTRSKIGKRGVEMRNLPAEIVRVSETFAVCDVLEKISSVCSSNNPPNIVLFDLNRENTNFFEKNSTLSGIEWKILISLKMCRKRWVYFREFFHRRGEIDEGNFRPV